jgi:hypothetical protein
MSRDFVAPSFRHVVRALTCAALASACLAAATPACAGAIAVLSRTAVQFGFVPRGLDSQVQPVFVTNTGDAALDIATLDLSGPAAGAFRLAGTCTPGISLAPLARCRIDLTMTPPLALGFGAPVIATLTLHANTGPVDVTLRGAVDPGYGDLAFTTSPAYLDIAAQAVGTAAPPQVVTITNRTTDAFTLARFGVVGGNAADFGMVGDCTPGQKFPGGASCTATITFTPLADGPRATELDIGTTLDAITGTLRVSITGVGGAAAPVTVVEYYNAVLDHYFITWVPAEQANLDAGNTPTRWTRTGYSFRAYTAAQAGTSPVCRYYIPPAYGDSHFFGRGTAECDATGIAHPAFVLEDPAFMHTYLPVAGNCPVGTTPVYRVFSNRTDANHRYMVDRAVRDQMVAHGWLAEGDGPDLVVMCSP